MVTYVGYSTIGSLTTSRTLVDKEIALRDLLNHFYTRKGERVMNPEFGCIAWDLLFEPLDKITEGELKRDVERIISTDPRWTLQSVFMNKPTDHSISVRANIIYNDTGTAEELFLDFTSENE
jgi:phage baseplate assembly protein W